MSEQRALFLRKGLIATCAFAAIVLLAGFYSIVSAAVDRAARQRAGASHRISQVSLTTTQRSASHSTALLARSDN
ncbi:MAG: hypothetical protein M3Z15_13475 [Pseudomonadota bacterium]|nr:hypothetical protein [Pseudomonadota bacterium]